MRHAYRRLLQLSYFTLPCWLLQGHATANEAIDRLLPKIIISGTSDFHGALEPKQLHSSQNSNITSSWGGITAYSAYIQTLRAHFNEVILLDAGDLFQGPMAVNQSHGQVMIRAGNALRLAAVAIGNHEFDYGLDALKTRISEAQFPFVALNIQNKTTHEMIDWPNLQGTRLFTLGSVKIGVIGITTPQTATSTRPSIVRDLHFAAPLTLVKRAAISLRNQGAQLVIVLGHLGGGCHNLNDPQDLSSCNHHGINAEMMTLLYGLPPGLVDIAIGGHTHQLMGHIVNGTMVIQSGANGKYFSYIEAVVRATGGLSLTNSKLHAALPLCMQWFANNQCTNPKNAPGPSKPALFLNQPLHPDPSVTTAIAPFIAAVQEQIHQILPAKLEQVMKRNTIAQLSAEGMQALLHTDFAVQNWGAVRAELPAGVVHFGEVYEALPFENYLVTAKLTGTELTAFIEGMVLKMQKHPPMLANLIIKQSPNHHIALLQHPAQTLLVPDQLYTVAMTDFLADGGDGARSAVKDLPRARFTYHQTGMREAFIAILQERFPNNIALK